MTHAPLSVDTIAAASFGMPQFLHSKLRRMELSHGRMIVPNSGVGPLRDNDHHHPSLRPLVLPLSKGTFERDVVLIKNFE